MTMHDKPRIARRSYLRGAGVTLATLGGMTGSVVAKGKGRGGPTPLTDRAADILIYWSQVDEDSNDPNEPGDFGFPASQHADGGLMLPAHDPAGGGLFDFGRIRMMPNGDLQNKWILLGGAVMATGPKPYSLVEANLPWINPNTSQGYQSVGQEMTFKARTANQIYDALGFLPPALEKLASGKWQAVGLEYAGLALDDNGEPDPTTPEWGATRVDFFDRKSGDYSLSLLYVIAADKTADEFDGPSSSPQAQTAAGALITGGRLNPGGQ